MSNGNANTHVTEVQQRGDDTLSVYIQTDSFKPGQEVEVSAVLTQGDASAIYVDKKRIPFSDPPGPTDSQQYTVLHAELPATILDPSKPVTIVTRVTEVWPTVVQPNTKKLVQYNGAQKGAYQELKAVWTFQGKEPGDSKSPSAGTEDGEVSATLRQ